MDKPAAPRPAWTESKPGNGSENSSAKPGIEPTGTTIVPGTNPSGITTIKVEHQSGSATQSDTHTSEETGVHGKLASGGHGQGHTKHGTGCSQWYDGSQVETKPTFSLPGIGNINQLLKFLGDGSTWHKLSKKEIAKKIATIDCRSVETEITNVAVMTKELIELRKDLDSKTKQLDHLEEQFKESCNARSTSEARVKELEKKIDQKQKKIDKHEQKSKQTDANHALTEENKTLKTAIYDLQKQLRDTEAEKKKIDDELIETKIRLSRLLGSKLTDGNADIADLSDENRPTKIAEKYSELYDNQWTDAFEVLQKYGCDEKTVIASLLDILLTVKQHCDGISANMTQGLVAAITITATTEGVSTIPDPVNKQLKDLKKLSAGVSVTTVFDLFIDKASKMWTTPSILHKALRESAIKVYIKECTSLCWLMCVQDPPLVINGKIQHADTFNSNHLKEYLQSGPVIDFLVWPPLYLKEGGSVLCKGIAQGMQISEKEGSKVQRPSSPDDPASARNEHQQKPNTVLLAQTTALKKGNTDHALLKQSPRQNEHQQKPNTVLLAQTTALKKGNTDHALLKQSPRQNQHQQKPNTVLLAQTTALKKGNTDHALLKQSPRQNHSTFYSN